MKILLTAILSTTVALAVLLLMQSPAQGQSAFPQGPGRDTLFLACSQCHSIGKILNAHLTADEWRFVVYDMISRGSPVHADDLNELTKYLQDNFATEDDSGKGS